MASKRPDQITWYRTSIARDELRTLTQKSDLAALVQTLGFLLVLGGTGTAAWMAWDAAEAGNFPVWGVVLLIFLHGTVAAFLLNGFHELVHNTVFRNKALGTFFTYVYSFLGWHDPIHFKESHKRHHLYTLHPPKDREVQLPIRMRVWHYLKVAIIDPLGLVQRVKGFVRQALGMFNNDWQRDIFNEEGQAAKSRLANYSRLFLLGHAAIVAAAVLTGSWQLIVLVTLAPFYGRWLEFLCNETQHIGLIDNVPDFRLCCRTFTVNPVIRFLYWNMNYHTEHHMYAAVPCYKLHRLHKRIQHDLPECPHGIIRTWAEIIRILRRKEEDPDYQFVPAVPNGPQGREALST